ncbi:MAG TPA: MBL fold metallo-hydrolase [Aliidongia sp.]|nr:MBL fold metallo-hydrolase [Aliidongia sp.]
MVLHTPQTTRRQILTYAASAAALPLLAAPSAAEAAGPMLGASTPRHYRFKLGAWEITTILDAGAMLDGPWPIVGEDQPQAAVEALMRENLLPEKKFQPGFTPMLVNTGVELILFDAGNGANGFVPRPDGGWLAALLKPAGFSADEIDLVVLTHGHPDHVGGLIEAGSPLFPNARYLIGDVEYDFWSSPDRLSGSTEAWARIFQSNVMPFAPKAGFIKPGGEVVPGIRAVEAYGHTPGHLAFHLESQGKQLFLWGDCAHHHIASLRRPDWHAVFDMDKEQGAATRRTVYDMLATERIAVAGYHMPFPSLGFVERLETGYRWIPVSYELNL